MQGDRLTSVIIPAGMSLVAGGMVVRGLFNMCAPPLCDSCVVASH